MFTEPSPTLSLGNEKVEMKSMFNREKWAESIDSHFVQSNLLKEERQIMFTSGSSFVPSSHIQCSPKVS